MNLLLTGPPRCGKTTLVERVVDALEGRLRLAGFLTREVRRGGERVGFDIRGHRITYSPGEHKLTALGHSAPLRMQDGRIRLRIIADVTSIEIFANAARAVMSFSLPIDPNNTSLSTFATGGKTKVDSLTVWQCKSIWPQ